MNLSILIVFIGFVLFFFLTRRISKRWLDQGMSLILYYPLVISLSVIGYAAVLFIIIAVLFRGGMC
jgi:ABC-type molybdate transport system permease subunit